MAEIKIIHMKNWFQSKIKYVKIDRNGAERKATDTILIEAVSYTDAETQSFEIAQTLTNSEFKVFDIKESKITEVFDNPEGELFYKAKISMISIDEDSGREKRMSNLMLVQADEINQALILLDKNLDYMLIPYVIDSIITSPITGVYYTPEETE